MIEIGKVAAGAVIAALCSVVIRKQTPELAMVLVLLAAALILGQSIGAVREIKTMLEQLRQMAGLSPAVVTPVIKTVGVALLTRFTAEICKDTGEGGLAACVETVGTITALLFAIPLLQTVFSMLTRLLE